MHGQYHPDSQNGTVAGQYRNDNGLGMTFVWCPGGAFEMKSNTDCPGMFNHPPTPVTLTHGFWMGKFEVTQQEFQYVTGAAPWMGQGDKPTGARYPANYVTWYECMYFCEAFNKGEQRMGRLPQGWRYSLPTEAQWERACRAGTTTNYHFGDTDDRMNDYAWWGGPATEGCTTEFECYPHEVGLKLPNGWGLHDMEGNVSEWCLDGFLDFNNLPGGTDPFIRDGKRRAVRGGSWIAYSAFAGSGSRLNLDPNTRDNEYGFRVALVRWG